MRDEATGARGAVCSLPTDIQIWKSTTKFNEQTNLSGRWGSTPSYKQCSSGQPVKKILFANKHSQPLPALECIHWHAWHDEQTFTLICKYHQLSKATFTHFRLLLLLLPFSMIFEYETPLAIAEHCQPPIILTKNIQNHIPLIYAII